LAPQPLKEEYLLTGPLEPTNEPYAIAKIAGIELCEAYNRQHGTNFLSVLPTNLYGPNDNYDLEVSHVLPALIRKFHLAKLASKGDWEGIKKDEACYGPIPYDIRARLMAISKHNGFKPPLLDAYSPLLNPAVVLWGTGSPKREFLYSDDLADACLFLMNRIEHLFSNKTSLFGAYHLINIGCGQDRTISELADLIAEEVGFEGQVEWDKAKPDGTPQKLLDVIRLNELDWRPKTSIEQGVRLAYQGYLSKY
jgi:GDP-L-fucose synthase